jgi:putative ABC transport system substrate-binding protein
MMILGAALAAATLAVGVLTAPLAVAAQPAGKVYRLGFLSGGSLALTKPSLEEFRQGLRELGYVEGKNIVIEDRWADGKQDRLPELAADLVRLKVDVIVAAISPAARAAHQATRTIPIVMIGVGDPIGLGLAASLARPGGNVTGTASYGPELAAKALGLLKEAVPSLKRVAILWTPDNPLHGSVFKDLEAPARSLAIELYPLKIVSPEDFEGTFSTAVTKHASAVWVLGDPMFSVHQARIAALAAKARLPTMFFTRGHVEAGGLMAYGPDFPHMYRQAAAHVAKIVNGAKPADLPIEQPTKFELVINLKTAKALGLTIPPSLLLRADRVIE